jgi:hypothetical protein
MLLLSGLFLFYYGSLDAFHVAGVNNHSQPYLPELARLQLASQPTKVGIQIAR